jgi:hypothetical protein
MRENQLPVHDTSAEETGRVRPAIDSGDGGVHIPRERVTHVEARPAGNYLADDLLNSVQTTLAKSVIKPGNDKAMCLAAQTSIPISDDKISSASRLGFKFADGTKVALSLSSCHEAAQNVTPMRGVKPPTHFSAAGSASAASAVAVAPGALPDPGNQYVTDDPERYTKLDEARKSKLAIGLLALSVIAMTTLYTHCSPKWSSFVAQTVDTSKQLSADIKRRASALLGGTAVTDAATAGAGAVAVGTAVTDTAKAGAGTVAGGTAVTDDATAGAGTVAGGTAVTDVAKAKAGTVAGAAGTAGAAGIADAAGIDGAPTGSNSASAVQLKGETAISDVIYNTVVHGVRLAAPASSRDVDQSASQHHGSSSAQPTLASASDETGTRENSRQHTHNVNHTARSKPGDFLVPPPPATPCVLQPAFGFFSMQPAQQLAAPKQQLQPAQAQASPRDHDQDAAQENTPQQSTEASGKTEATQSAALVAADQELQAALKSSQLTVGKWTR